MPKNKIQLQKGLSLQDLLKSYGKEDEYRNRLFKMRWPTGFNCLQCSYNHYYYVTIRNLYQCTMCKHQSSLISGTIFELSKLPLKLGFLQSIS